MWIKVKRNENYVEIWFFSASHSYAAAATYNYNTQLSIGQSAIRFYEQH